MGITKLNGDGSNQTVAGLKSPWHGGSGAQRRSSNQTVAGLKSIWSVIIDPGVAVFKSDRGGIEMIVGYTYDYDISKVQIRPWRD